MEKISEKKDELVITRIFDAPRDLVWNAWTDPEASKRWWGPKEYRTEHCEIDLRIDGRYLSNMISPEGQVFWSTGKYREIVPFERLVMTDSFADEKGNVVPATHYGFKDDFPLEVLVTVTLEKQGNQTKMTLKHTGLPAGEMLEGTKAGWNESFDKLEKHLKELEEQFIKEHMFKLESVGNEVVITEVFDAPRESIFKAYIDPDLIPKWWGPRMFTTTVEKLEPRPGGAWRFIQCGPDGNEYAFHGEFREIEQPDCLVYTFEYEGQPGHETIENISLDERDGKTIVTERVQFKSIEERDGMLQAGMEEGTRESILRLAELVVKM